MGDACSVATLPTRSRLISSGALIGLAVVLSMAGCASMPWFGLNAAKFEQADVKNPAVEILPFWQASEGPGPKGVPVRGLGGQIYFFAQAKGTPVVVDGALRIYLFDDRGSVKEQAQPIAVFDFDAAHLKNGAHNSALGAVYSLFLPYPRNDFHQARCSLRIRFTPTAGPTIYSDPATVVLSGPPLKPDKVDEPNIHATPERQVRSQFQNGGAASLTTSVTLPSGQFPGSRNVIPVNGTDDDTRMSLATDIAAPDNSRVQTADYTDDGPAPRANHIRLQSAQSDSSDRDGD
jgi:hypothetical protein